MLLTISGSSYGTWDYSLVLEWKEKDCSEWTLRGVCEVLLFVGGSVKLRISRLCSVLPNFDTTSQKSMIALISFIFDWKLRLLDYEVCKKG